MHTHYKTLGLTNAASTAEIRRAYRVLARRYHPDVNPDGASDEIFKEISTAYAILSDPEKRKQYDVELQQATESFEETFQRAHDALKRHQTAAARKRSAAAYGQQRAAKFERAEPRAEARNTTAQQNAHRAKSAKNTPPPIREPKLTSRDLLNRLTPIKTALNNVQLQAKSSISEALSYVKRALPKAGKVLGQLALMEVSISLLDAIQGTRKTVDISDDPTKPRKVSVPIPAGVHSGSIVRFRNRERTSEEVVLIIQVERHPWISIDERGVTIEIPLTIDEAYNGAKVQIPALNDPLLVTIEPRTQSGKEVRLKNQGVTYRDGSRGDLYVRFIVKNPDTFDEQQIEEIAPLYQKPVRDHLPTKILTSAEDAK
jgi:DnaJ-class molecular chaperone